MPRYGAGASRSGINTADQAWFALVGGAGDRLLVRQVVVGIAVAPSTAPSLYLARTTARGTQASTVAGQVFDAGDTSPQGTLDVCGTGGSAPTWTSANRIAVGALAVTAGGAWVWSFWDSPIIIPASSGAGIAICNANASGTTTGTLTCSVLWDE